MVKANLRKVGGSVMVAIPPAVLELVGLRADMEVGLTVENGNLVIQPKARRYSLNDLIAECDLSQQPEDREFVDAPPVGGELL
jgi:antitoxin ChpS